MSISKFLQSYFNFFLFKFFGVNFFYKYLKFLGKIYYVFYRKEWNLIKSNIREIFPEKYNTIAESTFDGIIRHYFEKFFITFYNFPKLIKYLKKNIEFSGLDKINESLKKNKGVILVSGHFGAIEFIPVIFSLLKYKVNITAKFKSKHVQEVLEKRASVLNINIINCNEKNNILVEAFKCLNRNEILITECDEINSWHKNSSKTMTFFENKIYLDRIIDVLHNRSGADVLSIFAKRKTDGSICMEINNITDIESKKTNESMQHRIMNVLQKYIKEYPEQWYEWKKFSKMKVKEV